MIECQVQECGELAESRGFCRLHLRRWIDGLTREDDDGNFIDYCIREHALVGDNVRWEATGKRGGKRRRCRECLRAKAKRQARNHAAEEPKPPKPYRPEDETLTKAIDDFELAQELIPGKCQNNPGPYMDWEEPPTQAEADALCYGCPLIMACANYGIAAREFHGIWGGLVIHEGKVLEYDESTDL